MVMCVIFMLGKRGVTSGDA